MSHSASKVVEDYVTVIWKAQEYPENDISSSEISKRLGVAKSTVSETLRRLANDGWINYQPYGAITLTDSGQKLAESIVRKHRIIETLLVEKLGYRWDEVHEEADRLEHAISDRLLDRIDTLLGHPSKDPHGDLIPPFLDSRPQLIRLDSVDITSGSSLCIERVSDDSPEILRYLEENGIGPGTVLENISYSAELNILEYTSAQVKKELCIEALPYLYGTVLENA